MLHLNCFVADTELSVWNDGLLLWLVNILIMGFCLVKMFVYGDPILPSKSKESQIFWRHRKQADYYLSNVGIMRTESLGGL